MIFNFQLRTVGDWRHLQKQMTRSTWNQTIEHANAALKRDQRGTKFATIEKHGQVIGMMAILELKFGPVHFISLVRGPLWMAGQDTAANLLEFANEFSKLYPKRLFRRIRWMPEFTFADNNIDFLEDNGYKITPQKLETIWLDIRPPIEELRKNLQQKWRNALNKAERSPLHVTAENTGKRLDHFLQCYTHFKAAKKFKGPSADFIRCEVESALPFKDAFFLWASIENVPVAGMLVMRHGNSASYRIGWNTEEGRKHNSHNLLLWKSIELLKKCDVEYFDLGGIMTGEADGLTHFKKGVNGEIFMTPVFG